MAKRPRLETLLLRQICKEGLTEDMLTYKALADVWDELKKPKRAEFWRWIAEKRRFPYLHPISKSYWWDVSTAPYGLTTSHILPNDLMTKIQYGFPKLFLHLEDVRFKSAITAFKKLMRGWETLSDENIALLWKWTPPRVRMLF